MLITVVLLVMMLWCVVNHRFVMDHWFVML